MSVANLVLKRMELLPERSWVRPADFGGGNAVELTLSRAARDPEGLVVRAAKGLYFKSGPADPVFGKRRPRPVEVAVQVATDRGVGPAGAAAAAYFGLTTQVPPFTELTVVGKPPTGVSGVRWSVRNNPLRANLNFSETAVLELLTTYPVSVESTWKELTAAVQRKATTGEVDLPKVLNVARKERRKPQLLQNVKQLAADLRVPA